MTTSHLQDVLNRIGVCEKNLTSRPSIVEMKINSYLANLKESLLQSIEVDETAFELLKMEVDMANKAPVLELQQNVTELTALVAKMKLENKELRLWENRKKIFFEELATAARTLTVAFDESKEGQSFFRGLQTRNRDLRLRLEDLLNRPTQPVGSSNLSSYGRSSNGFSFQ